jgi:hypothetical protein
MATALELVREYMDNEKITIDEVTGEVELRETGQRYGYVFIGESAVRDHLETLARDYSNEWTGVEDAVLYHSPYEANEGLRYLGDEVWYQSA